MNTDLLCYILLYYATNSKNQKNRLWIISAPSKSDITQLFLHQVTTKIAQLTWHYMHHFIRE